MIYCGLRSMAQGGRERESRVDERVSLGGPSLTGPAPERYLQSAHFTKDSWTGRNLVQSAPECDLGPWETPKP